MVTLLVVSFKEAAGKTAICAGMGSYFMGAGKKVGFFKLAPDGADHSDAAFMKQALSLAEEVQSISPSISDGSTLVDKVKEAYARVADGNDIVIVEPIKSKLFQMNLPTTALIISTTLGTISTLILMLSFISTN